MKAKLLFAFCLGAGTTSDAFLRGRWAKGLRRTPRQRSLSPDPARKKMLFASEGGMQAESEAGDDDEDMEDTLEELRLQLLEEWGLSAAPCKRTRADQGTEGQRKAEAAKLSGNPRKKHRNHMSTEHYAHIEKVVTFVVVFFSAIA